MIDSTTFNNIQAALSDSQAVLIYCKCRSCNSEPNQERKVRLFRCGLCDHNMPYCCGFETAFADFADAK
ncbi:MAG: hypothetical protein WBB43_27035 [Limnoraphis sp.]